MGGVLILLAVSISTLLWADLTNGYVWVILFVTVGFGLVGFADDYLKLTRRSHKGVSSRIRLGVEIAISLVAAIWVIQLTGPELTPRSRCRCSRTCCSSSAGSSPR